MDIKEIIDRFDELDSSYRLKKHQFTNDFFAELKMALRAADTENKAAVLRNISERIASLIEICDERNEDYAFLTKLKTILNESHD